MAFLARVLLRPSKQYVSWSGQKDEMRHILREVSVSITNGRKAHDPKGQLVDTALVRRPIERAVVIVVPSVNYPA